MNENAYNQALAKGSINVNEPIVAPQEDTPSVLEPDPLSQFIAVLHLLKVTKKQTDAAPTLIPKNLIEQIQFYENGTTRRLYIYVNKTWRYVALT